jgi:hypothetical protein
MTPRARARWAASLFAWGAFIGNERSLAAQGSPQDRHPPLTVAWVAAQLVPSPLVAFGREAALGLRWQLTPLLYSWGRYHELSPWRAFVIEPPMRLSGSVEAFVSPEYVALGPRAEDRWIARGGARAYVPLLHRGEYLSASLGGSAYVHRGDVGPTIEAGIYAVFGIVGLQVSYSPLLAGGTGMAALCLRYF